MAKIISVVAVADKSTVIKLAITAPAGGAGAQLAYSSPSSKVTIFNTSGTTSFEYNVGGGVWKNVMPNTGTEEQINIAASPIFFRQTLADPNTPTVEITIDSKTNLQGFNTSWAVNSAGSPIVTIRPVTNAQPNGAYDTSTFRQIFQAPVKGKCLVRAVIETTTATSTVIDSVAISAGRNYSNDDPVKADGTPGDWTVLTAVAISAATDPGNGVFGTGRTPWVLVDIPAPTDGGMGGYIYAGVKLAGGTRLGMVGNGTSRSIAEYEGYISAKVPALKYRGLRKSGSDFVNSNQNAMGASGPLYLSEFAPVCHIELAPVTRVISIAHFGDSTGDGLGTGTPLVQPNHYNWALIAANSLIQEQGIVVAVSNFCHEGKKTIYNIQGRLGTLLADPEFCPSAVIIQPFSINDGATVGALTQAVVDAAVTIALTQAVAARKRGIIPIFRTVIPSVSLNSTTDAFRKAGNDAIRASGEFVIDLDSEVTDGATPARLLPIYSLDGTHMSQAGNEKCAPATASVIRAIFFQ